MLFFLDHTILGDPFFLREIAVLAFVGVALAEIWALKFIATNWRKP